MVDFKQHCQACTSQLSQEACKHTTSSKVTRKRFEYLNGRVQCLGDGLGAGYRDKGVGAGYRGRGAGVEGAGIGVEGAGSGQRGGGILNSESGKIGREIVFFL